MSTNWVMLDGKGGFVLLPAERIIHKSGPRVALAITTPTTYPGNSPLSIQCTSGTVHLTNQRIVYMPEKSTADFQSFSAPLLNLHDTHLTVPWFGPNAWLALLQPVPGGNLPATQAAIELKLTFKEGGAPDFHSNVERIKERLQQVVSNARENNLTGSRGAFPTNVDLDNVHLDELPSYQDSGHDRIAPEAADEPRNTVAPPVIPSTVVDPQRTSGPQSAGPASQNVPPPSDAPPGYEETQQQSIQAELDRRLS